MASAIYLPASEGTGPLLVGLAGHAFSTDGFAAASAAFTMAGVTLVALIFVAVLAVATAEAAVAKNLQASAPKIKRFAGYLVMLVGIWMLALAVFAEWFANIFPA